MRTFFASRLQHSTSLIDGRGVESNQSTASQTDDLFFKFISQANGPGYFSYVSESAPRLLGLSPRALCNDAERFVEMIHPADREDFLQSLELSQTTLLEWRWEGNVIRSGSQDSKRIRIRASARSRMDGRVVWDGVMQSAQTRDRVTDTLSAQDQLALLASRQTRAREDERLRIAQDLHDDVGGHLAGIKLQLALIQQRLCNELKDRVAPQLTQLDELIDRTIDSTRRLTSHLRPPILDLGLIPAIEWLIEDFNSRAPANIGLDTAGDLGNLPEELQVGLFRICQEALNNAFKHAEAKRVHVRLEMEDNRITLDITDDGLGFRQDDCRRSDAFGLSGMDERAVQLGGVLSIHSAPNEGTRIRLQIPA